MAENVSATQCLFLFKYGGMVAKLSKLKPRVSTLSTVRVAPAAVERLRGRAGMRAREAVLKRDGYLCQMCLPERAVIATEVDHIMPLHLGGGDNAENKQSLCSECHEAKTKAECELRRGGGSNL